MKRVVEIPDVVFNGTMEQGRLSYCNVTDVYNWLKDSENYYECDCVSRKGIDEIFKMHKISADDCNGLYKDICGLPSVYPKNDNSVVKDIKSEIQRFKDITSDSNEIHTIDYILSIFDKHISGKE